MSLEDLRKKGKQDFINRIVSAIEDNEEHYFKFESNFNISDLKPELDVVKFDKERTFIHYYYYYLLEYKDKYYIISDDIEDDSKNLHKIVIKEVSEAEAFKIMK